MSKRTKKILTTNKISYKDYVYARQTKAIYFKRYMLLLSKYESDIDNYMKSTWIKRMAVVINFLADSTLIVRRYKFENKKLA